MRTIQKGRLKANASLISMVQRFSDLFIIISGLYFSAYMTESKFTDKHLLAYLFVVVVFQMIGGITDFYRSWRGVKISAELQLIVKNWTMSLILTAGIINLLGLLSFKTETYIIWFFSVCVGLSVFRIIIRMITGFARKLGYNTRTVAIVGNLSAGYELAEGLNEQPWMGLRVLGFYSDENPNFSEGICYLGGIDSLIDTAKSGGIDRVYIAMPMSEETKIRDIISSLSDTTCSVMLIPDIFTFNLVHSKIEEINNVPIISLFDTPMSGINRLIKRLEDIILSLLILIFISPVLLLIAMSIKITSQGPVIFRQTRYGIDGRAIKVLKFRSMNVMENDGDITQAKKGDLRITPIGAFLRKTSLDELPQFFNVLKGDMSIVGPRPHAVAHNEQYRRLIRGYMLRHKVKPGITGWAQINGWRGETDTLEKMEKRIEFDLDYIQTWSVWFDLKIIFLTIFKGFINKSAY
ncbi:Putative colanic biosynthesis UDP-glucose lipid carrier transferase [Serratia fonticola]|uniref:undecaprenyl-phosphate glucose phosphotransferase n=1 Tax=Serratia fonticola TaxID=47917 RepID=UPI00217BEF63|nr:undecaprenyl-phosphate glucose phosphotransferase [Serratia fonticola]CAI1766289.1 Putative colanic biosynthesis UDP-glucose lipid carrier transferase [Serratia fonticola]